MERLTPRSIGEPVGGGVSELRIHIGAGKTKESGIFFVTVRAENLSGPTGFLDP
jgi:putative component of toxin-antitoxin plasmid stabilization module